MPEPGFHFWITLLFIAAVLAVIMGICAYMILLERKIAAWTQDRLGPNRVGPRGLLQPIADGLKFLFKEEVIPVRVDRLFYLLAPGIALGTSLLAFAVVPFGPTPPPPLLQDHRAEDGTGFVEQSRGVIWPQTKSELEQVLQADRAYAAAHQTKTYEEQMEEYNQRVSFVIAPHLEIGILFLFAVGSLAVYAIVLGGWASNNKYSLLGSLRSSAQMLSYEIPLGLAVLGALFLTGSLNLERLIHYQIQHGWNIIFQPLAALLFAISIFAECNRLPFDLPEAEQELVGGYHTEYSGMKFALFFLGEYAHMITTSFVVVAVFLGGWHFPYIAPAESTGGLAAVLKVLVFAGKMGMFILLYMFVRWTIPRFRFDQLMGLAWKVLIPLALINLVVVVVVRHYQPLGGYSAWLILPLSIAVLVGAGALAIYFPGQSSRLPLETR
jgi:NADH-quinone oxidoreductase subunit H